VMDAITQLPITRIISAHRPVALAHAHHKLLVENGRVRSLGDRRPAAA
jgi:ABC-type bacteriocin/lantibiotic exporter with double-glycine peptidase domain